MKRNYGIDFLRIISMFMVAIIHILGQGGILSNADSHSLKYWLAWLIEISCYCCVNCFALVSGYVMSQAKYKFSRIPKLWFQTIFYSISILLIFLVFWPDAVQKRHILDAVFPITRSEYWYISAYFGMLFLAPLLNTIIEHTEQCIFRTVLLSMFVIFCTLPVILRASPYGLNSGYSMIWLCLLYLVGGYMCKYEVAKKIKTSYAWYTILAMIALTCSSKFVFQRILRGIPFLASFKNAFIAFTSPTIVLIAISLVIIFSKMTIHSKPRKIIKFIAPSVLGVYLLHVHPLIWDNIIKDSAICFLNHNCFSMVCLIILSSLLIFFAGITVDILRIKLFDLLQINRLCCYFDKLLTKTPENV